MRGTASLNPGGANHEQSTAVMTMTQIKMLMVALAIAVCSCDRPATLSTPAGLDADHWTVEVEKFTQSDTLSTMRFRVESPVPARITFYEPDSVLHQSFLSPAGRTFEVRKELKPGVRSRTVLMETTINSGSPSITDLAPDVTISQLHSRVLDQPRAVAFGQSVVIADNVRQRQTTVLVDLEPEIDPELSEAFQARRNTRNQPDPR